MSFGGRIASLERATGGSPEQRVVTAVMLVDDPGCPVAPEEFEAFIATLPAAGEHLTILYGSDNGRGEWGARIVLHGYGQHGIGFCEVGRLIRGGHLVPRTI